MTADRLFVARPDVVDCDLGGDRALLNLKTNTYFTMNGTAATIWQALHQPTSMDDLVAAVTHKFEVTDAVCRPDVVGLIDAMLEAEIIDTVPAMTVTR